MTKTYCDFCGKEQGYNHLEVVTVDMPILSADYKSNKIGVPKIIIKQKDICNECVEKMQIALTGSAVSVRI